MPMTISVITAVYNRADCIGEALASLHAQTWPWIEHIVIDGGSDVPPHLSSTGI
jgi:glycosyltransferase involved in cell wall biosynthesis